MKVAVEQTTRNAGSAQSPSWNHHMGRAEVGLAEELVWSCTLLLYSNEPSPERGKCRALSNASQSRRRANEQLTADWLCGLNHPKLLLIWLSHGTFTSHFFLRQQHRAKVGQPGTTQADNAGHLQAAGNTTQAQRQWPSFAITEMQLLLWNPFLNRSFFSLSWNNWLPQMAQTSSEQMCAANIDEPQAELPKQSRQV